LVTPIHKKGDKQELANYRPVSCLPAASKVLEAVVCTQMSDYLESKGLLPKNQHGFRPQRSTMTAWADIQQEWALKTEANEITGVMLWDLSAAFDTLDPGILCKKLEIYGFDKISVNWFRSFITGRSQRVKTNQSISGKQKLESGVPQCGVPSPLVFVLYVSDLEDWIVHSSAVTYADDTTTSTHSKELHDLIKKMELDAVLVLKFMASNGLIANPAKTSLLFLNLKNSEEGPIEMKIGKEKVKQENMAKLLGMQFDDTQQWKTHLYNKGGLT
jgi:hypothetical protein